MKKNTNFSTNKIFFYIYASIFALFLICVWFLFSFINVNVYQAINIDSRYLLSQRKGAKESLDTKGLEEVLEKIKQKSKTAEIGELEDIFN